MKKPEIKIGDKYIKVDAPTIFWIVDQLLNGFDTIPHVCLVQEGTTNRKITLSIPALRDTSIYKKI